MSFVETFQGGGWRDSRPTTALPTKMSLVLGLGAASTAIDNDLVVKLFDEYATPLTRAVRLLVDDSSEAEDIVQEAFARFLTSRRRMRNLDQAPAYLRSTAFNLARSSLRKRGSARRKANLLETDAAQIQQGQSLPDTVVTDNVMNDALLAHLATLPGRQRECLVLRFLMSLSENEIAHTLNISTGSVKTHTSRGLATMQQLIGTNEGQND